MPNAPAVIRRFEESSVILNSEVGRWGAWVARGLERMFSISSTQRIHLGERVE
jgi:hypothetical protein